MPKNFLHHPSAPKKAKISPEGPHITAEKKNKLGSGFDRNEEAYRGSEEYYKIKFDKFLKRNIKEGQEEIEFFTLLFQDSEKKKIPVFGRSEGFPETKMIENQEITLPNSFYASYKHVGGALLFYGLKVMNVPQIGENTFSLKSELEIINDIAAKAASVAVSGIAGAVVAGPVGAGVATVGSLLTFVDAKKSDIEKIKKDKNLRDEELGPLLAKAQSSSLALSKNPYDLELTKKHLFNLCKAYEYYDGSELFSVNNVISQSINHLIKIVEYHKDTISTEDHLYLIKYHRKLHVLGMKAFDYAVENSHDLQNKIHYRKQTIISAQINVDNLIQNGQKHTESYVDALSSRYQDLFSLVEKSDDLALAFETTLDAIKFIKNLHTRKSYALGLDSVQKISIDCHSKLSALIGKAMNSDFDKDKLNKIFTDLDYADVRNIFSVSRDITLIRNIIKADPKKSDYERILRYDYLVSGNYDSAGYLYSNLTKEYIMENSKEILIGLAVISSAMLLYKKVYQVKKESSIKDRAEGLIEDYKAIVTGRKASDEKKSSQVKNVELWAKVFGDSFYMSSETTGFIKALNKLPEDLSIKCVTYALSGKVPTQDIEKQVIDKVITETERDYIMGNLTYIKDFWPNMKKFMDKKDFNRGAIDNQTGVKGSPSKDLGVVLEIERLKIDEKEKAVS